MRSPILPPHTDTDQFERLRIAALTGHLPPDLGAWALAQVAGTMDAAHRRRRRNALLRAAATRAEGSRWAKASEMSRYQALFRECPGLAVAGNFGADTPASLVQQAWCLEPVVLTRRQLLRIIGR